MLSLRLLNNEGPYPSPSTRTLYSYLRANAGLCAGYRMISMAHYGASNPVVIGRRTVSCILSGSILVVMASRRRHLLGRSNISPKAYCHVQGPNLHAYTRTISTTFSRHRLGIPVISCSNPYLIFTTLSGPCLGNGSQKDLRGGNCRRVVVICSSS